MLLLPLLSSCLPQSPKDFPTEGEAVFDPLALYAWHVENTGQKSFSASAGIAGQDHKIKMAHNWGITGKNIRIAVSDDGVEINHPDLEQNQLAGEHRDYNADSPYLGDPTPQNDLDAHGTAVTGLIAAVKGNTIGSFGVAPDAQFAGFNFITSEQEPSFYLHQFTGDFNIFNYSYGQASHLITENFDVNHELALRNGSENGSIYVKAAGNGFSGSLSEDYTYWGNANYEAEQSLPYYIIVGAINARGFKASYSTPGANLWISGAGGEDGIVAPAMLTTDLQGCSRGYAHQSLGYTPFDLGNIASNIHCDFTNSMNGTSSATPVISGIIALMLEAQPNLTWRDVKHILAKTADKVDQSSSSTLIHPQPAFELPGHVYDYKWVLNAAGNFFSNWYGFGRANAQAAVEMALSYSFPLGEYIPGSYVSSPALSLTIPSTAAGVTNDLVVSTLINKIEAVQIEVEVNHSFIGELAVELTSPSATTSKILLINSMTLNLEGDARTLQLLSNAFYEEDPNGTWRIRVIDGEPTADVGSLLGWSIKVSGSNRP